MKSDRGNGAESSMRAAIVLACYAALSMTSAPAGAQSMDYAGLESLFGEPVTRSVTGSPQRASDVPASMLIITAEEIRRSGARDIPGVLRHHAGIEVDRTSREYADVTIRGYNQAFNPRLLVLVDGRQVYADYYGFTPWSTIPVELEAIRQIEVVKGPAGALFGFNAAGGVVNIVTYDPLRDTEAALLSVRGGSNGLAQASAVSRMKLGEDAALSLMAGSRRSDEFSTPRQPGDIATDRSNRRNAASADAHIALRPALSLGVEVTYSSSEQHEMAPTYTQTFGQYETHSVRTHWEADTGLGLVNANLYRNSIETDAFIRGSSEPARRFRNNVVVAQIDNVFKAGVAHILRVAGEFRRNSMDTTPVGGAEISYDVLALTGMWDWSLTARLTLHNSIRIDRWELGREGFLPPEYVENFGLSNALWDISRDESSFNSGLIWQMSDTSSIRFSAGKARQLPNLLNLGGDFSEAFGFYFVGVPWLEPTDVTNSEMHWERRLSGSGIRIDVGVFSGRTENIQSVFFGTLGNSQTKGIELAIRGATGERWSWDLSALRQDIDDKLNPLFPTVATLVDYDNTTPERTIKGHVAWTRGPWEIDGFARYQSRSLGIRGPAPGEFTASFVEIPGHVRFDVNVSYTMSSQLRLSLSGRSLARSNQRQTGAPEVDRQAIAALQYTFDRF